MSVSVRHVVGACNRTVYGLLLCLENGRGAQNFLTYTIEKKTIAYFPESITEAMSLNIHFLGELNFTNHVSS